MDKRLKEISFQLSEYSLGRFDKKIEISDRLDEVDAISSNINMLGEELKEITISRNYFTNIFNSVSDMVFVLTNKGIIKSFNQQVEIQLKIAPEILKNKSINDLLQRKLFVFNNVYNQLKKGDSEISEDGFLQTSDGYLIPVRMKFSYFQDEQKNQLILLTASDITFQINDEKRIIRAIIDTEEKERRRFAKDLHDSLAQQLAAIKFRISTAVGLTKNPTQKSILSESNQGLTNAMNDMKSICFNLMPQTLEEFGLLKAVQQFCKYLSYQSKLKFIIKQKNGLLDLSRELKVDIYRIIQEFITNTIKHGEATSITVSFGSRKKTLVVNLIDNGKGFDIDHSRKGMGLHNVKSRVKSHDGTLNIVSNIGKGTTYEIIIPLKNQV